jgi:hypothetical protein
MTRICSKKTMEFTGNSEHLGSPVIPPSQTVSQFAKGVIPDSPAQPGVTRNPGVIK